MGVQHTITPDPKYFANLHAIRYEDGEARKKMNTLKDISGEVYPLAPLDEDGEEGTATCADEDDKNGADPQAEVGVSATAGAAV